MRLDEYETALLKLFGKVRNIEGVLYFLKIKTYIISFNSPSHYLHYYQQEESILSILRVEGL